MVLKIREKRVECRNILFKKGYREKQALNQDEQRIFQSRKGDVHMPIILKDVVVGFFSMAAAGLFAFQGIEVVSAVVDLVQSWKQN